jgi:hypothetical protein
MSVSRWGWWRDREDGFEKIVLCGEWFSGENDLVDGVGIGLENV